MIIFRSWISKNGFFNRNLFEWIKPLTETPVVIWLSLTNNLHRENHCMHGKLLSSRLCVKLAWDWLLYFFSPKKYAQLNGDKSCNWYFHISLMWFYSKVCYVCTWKAKTFGPWYAAMIFWNSNLSFEAVFSVLWNFFMAAPNVLLFRT